MKNICLVYRPHSTRAAQTAKQVAKWLKARLAESGKTLRGPKLFTHPDLKIVAGTKRLQPRDIATLDLVIVLGGDGTFLHAVRMLDARPVPILGVNLGNLGFLTETRVEELYDVLELALQNKMQEVKRSTLHAAIFHKNKKRHDYHALNDIVVERGPNARIINMSIYADAFLVSTVKADGLIVATPTGSTAYCLAAGGPIVQPNVRAVTITPICPHTLTNRPIILCDDQKIRLKLSQDPGRAVLMLDGQRREDLTSDDVLVITKGKTPVIMLSLPSRNYFDVLRAKLRFGQRE